MINIIEWIGTGLFAMLAIGSIASGGIVFGLFFVFLAALVSPKRKELINSLPEKFRKKSIIALTGIILFFVGGLTLPGDIKNNDNNQVADSTTVAEAEGVVDETTTEAITTEKIETDNSTSKDNTTEEITTENVAKENDESIEKRTETLAENNNETIATTETQQTSQTTVTEAPQTTQMQFTEAPSTTQAQTTESVQTTQTPSTEAAQTTQASASNNGGGDLNGYPATQPLEGRIVYITNTGQKYHESGCRMLKDSKIEISLTEAESRGYTPCGICH